MCSDVLHPDDVMSTLLCNICMGPGWSVCNREEVLQSITDTQQKPELIAGKAIEWLSDPQKLERQKEAQRKALSRMQGKGHSSAEISADAILSVARGQAVLPQE